MEIRPAEEADRDAIWAFLKPVILAGEVFALPTGMDREAALQYWFTAGNWVHVVLVDGQMLGSYYLRANQQGGGSHVANCGYLTAISARGRGIAAAMCAHSLELGKSLGFRAMQFNFVVSSNTSAVHVWEKCGFKTLARLPDAFLHPSLGYVDALVMWREL